MAFLTHLYFFCTFPHFLTKWWKLPFHPHCHCQLLSLHPRAEEPTGLRHFLAFTSMHFRFTLWASKGSWDKQALTWALARVNKISPNLPQCQTWARFCLAGWESMCPLEASPWTGILSAALFWEPLQGLATPFPGDPATWAGMRARAGSLLGSRPVSHLCAI